MTAPPIGNRLGGHPLLLLAGFVIWCSALVLVYALHAIGCSFGWETIMLRSALAVVVVLHLGLIAIGWRRLSRAGAGQAAPDTASFLHWVTLGTLVSAFVTLVFTLGPTLLLTTCT